MKYIYISKKHMFIQVLIFLLLKGYNSFLPRHQLILFKHYISSSSNRRKIFDRRIECTSCQCKIIVNREPTKKPDITKLRGFYGMVGPNINITNIDGLTLYDLFTGDGIIHGVFFDNGNITFVKHIMRTEKRIYEEIHGKFPQHILFLPLFVFMNTLGMIPNILGLANTAFLKINKQMYVLFERDSPYSIHIDFINQKINTIQKIRIPVIQRFSGHSKYNRVSTQIHTIDYNIIRSSLVYYCLNNSNSNPFEIVKRIAIKTNYIPIIHDFEMINNENTLLFFDCPLEFDFPQIINRKMPLFLSSTKPTFLHTVNTTDNTRRTYTFSESFYLFHYGNVFENPENIVIYAPLYDTLDFNVVQIRGKYRKIIVDKYSGNISIVRNPDLEKYNLDFPIFYKEYTILKNIDYSENRSNGFVICHELNIIHTLFFKDKSICGEPSIISTNNRHFLSFFLYDTNRMGYLRLIELPDRIDNITHLDFIEIPLNTTIGIGFHSIYTDQY